jgi:hypothetical protein
MRNFASIIASHAACWLLMPLCAMSSGCAMFNAPPAQPPIAAGNAVILPRGDRDLIWDMVVDVVDDDFEIQREERPRQIGDVLTEGRLESRPKIGATYLEPWRGDSVSSYDRLESTLQTIRRKAIVQMAPTGAGYQVQVTVLKELENLQRPEYAATSAAIFRHDSSLRRFAEPVDEVAVEQGWIPLGSDQNLEQKILGKIADRLGG